MEGFLGEVKMFAGTFAPRGWAICDGRMVAISENAALYSLLGTQFGGDGRTTFGLPDLRGRVPVGAGDAPGLTSRRSGERGGTEWTQLSLNNMPTHNHAVACDMKTVGRSLSADPENNIPARITQGEAYGADLSEGRHMNGEMISSVGAGQPHDNMQPWLGINYIICIQGEFPSRN